jgi:hypothetical protein
VLERIDHAVANRMALGGSDPEPVATAQRMLDPVRSPTPGDATFMASLLRLRGFVVLDEDAAAVLEDRPGRLADTAQEHRMLRGLQRCLLAVRQRAEEGAPPDGWFLVEMFRDLTAELPRFRGSELRRGPPWDALLHLNYPPPAQLHSLVDSFDAEHRFRDAPGIFDAMHPVRQGLRILWRFARIAPFPDMNVVMAWLAMNSWLQVKGYPLLPSVPGDQVLIGRIVTGPPPTKLSTLESRLLGVLTGPQ